jgi:hypothetical protein
MRHSLAFVVQRLVGCGVMSLLLAGCGESGPHRYHVAGKITWRGQPIPAGILYFDPDIAAGHDGPQGYAIIQDGQFDTRNEGAGQGGGKYVLRVFGADGIPGPEAPMGKPLFPEHTQLVDLPVEDATWFWGRISRYSYRVSVTIR